MSTGKKRERERETKRRLEWQRGRKSGGAVPLARGEGDS